jgi:hypothetical protein
MVDNTIFLEKKNKIKGVYPESWFKIAVADAVVVIAMQIATVAV